MLFLSGSSLDESLFAKKVAKAKSASFEAVSIEPDISETEILNLLFVEDLFNDSYSYA